MSDQASQPQASPQASPAKPAQQSKVPRVTTVAPSPVKVAHKGSQRAKAEGVRPKSRFIRARDASTALLASAVSVPSPQGQTGPEGVKAWRDEALANMRVFVAKASARMAQEVNSFSLRDLPIATGIFCDKILALEASQSLPGPTLAAPSALASMLSTLATLKPSVPPGTTASLTLSVTQPGSAVSAQPAGCPEGLVPVRPEALKAGGGESADGAEIVHHPCSANTISPQKAVSHTDPAGLAGSGSPTGLTGPVVPVDSSSPAVPCEPVRPATNQAVSGGELGYAGKPVAGPAVLDVVAETVKAEDPGPANFVVGPSTRIFDTRKALDELAMKVKPERPVDPEVLKLLAKADLAVSDEARVAAKLDKALLDLGLEDQQQGTEDT